MTDFAEEYERWSSRPTSRTPPSVDDEAEVRALAQALKATGLPLAGAMTAAAAAGVMFAELRDAGYVVTRRAEG